MENRPEVKLTIQFRKPLRHRNGARQPSISVGRCHLTRKRQASQAQSQFVAVLDGFKPAAQQVAELAASTDRSGSAVEDSVAHLQAY